MKSYSKIAMMILIITTLTIGLTGCWNRRELPSLAIVLGFGIDKGEDKDPLDLTVQIVKTAELKSSSPEGVGAGGGSNGAGAYWNVKNSGESIFGVLRDFTHKSSRKLYWPHNQVIIFGRSLAKEGVSEYLDFFLRDQEPRLEVFILVAEDKASDIFDVKPKLEKVPATNISDLMDAQAATSQTSIIKLYQFAARLMSKTTAPIAPMIKIEGEGDNQVLTVFGTAVFKKDKMIGELNKEETRGLLWVIDKVKSGIIDINCPDSDDNVSLEIIRSKGKIKSEIIDDKPHITVEIKEEGNIASQACSANLTSPDAVAELEEQESKAIQEEIESALSKAKKLNADIFGFGEVIHQRHPQEWLEMQDDWDEIFPDLDVDIVVEAKLRRSGSINRPAAPEKE